jgi:hypothetical protein
VDHLIARKLTIDNMIADVAWVGDRATLQKVRGRTFGGDLSGTATIDFAPTFTTTGTFTLNNADVASSAVPVGVAWGQGRASLNGDFSFEGTERAKVVESLRANLHFTMQNGTLRRFGPRGDLPYRSWTGDAEIAGRTLKITRSSLRTGNDTLAFAGTVGSDLVLDLKATTASTVTSITGTLGTPTVTTSTTTTYSASNPQDATSAPAKKRD